MPWPKGKPNPGGGWADPTHPAHRPAGGGQPVPYEKGNLEALRHGALSARAVEAVAADIVAAAVTEVPYLSEGKFAATLQAWARAEGRVRLLERFLEENGHLDGEGAPRSAAAFQLQCEKQAAGLRSQLGLTPESAARIGRDVAGAQVDIARLWAEEEDK